MNSYCIVCYGRESEDVLVSFKHDVLGHDVIIEDVPASMCVSCGERWYGPKVVDDVSARYRKLRDPILAAHRRNGFDPDAYEPRPTQTMIQGRGGWEDVDDYGTVNEAGEFIPTPPEAMKKIEELRARNLLNAGV